MIALALVVAALAYLFWPRGAATVPAPPAAADLFRVPAPPPPPPAPPRPTPPAAPGEREAIDSLLVIRNRLAADGVMDEGSAKAIDQLALDLLHQGIKR